MYQKWFDDARTINRDECVKLTSKYLELVEAMNELRISQDLSVLKNADVVGFTVSGCAKYHSLLKALAPTIVLCEEAGEVLEAHLLAALNRSVEQLILIGDHQQLRPKVNEYSLQVEAGGGFHFDRSLFERLVTEQAAATDEEDNDEKTVSSLVTLQVQRRMYPTIADLPRNILYPMLQDHESVRRHPPVRGLQGRLVFFDHNYAENTDEAQGGGAKSYCNSFEAKMVVKLVKHFARNGYNGNNFAILTPYVGQLLCIRKLLQESSMTLVLNDRDADELDAMGFDVEDDDNDHKDSAHAEAKSAARVQTVSLSSCVRLATVDNFQGEEADLVIVSTVRCNNRNRTGFLKTDNRVNVMLSRAKHGMIILGSANTIQRSSPRCMFAKCVAMCRNANLLLPHIPLKCERHPEHPISVRSPDEFAQLAPEGGCKRPCEGRLPCGHRCHRACHPDDRDHISVKCLERCNNQLSQELCGSHHQCTRLCFEECGPCADKIRIRHPRCGHIVNTTCGELAQKSADTIRCTEKESVLHPICGHPCNLPCWEARRLREICWIDGRTYTAQDLALLKKCPAKCEHKMDVCSHACGKACFSCVTESKGVDGFIVSINHGECKSKCDRQLICRHRCPGVCHKAGECPPCEQKCSNRCPHSTCGKLCRDVCVSCSHDCDWKCSTQHDGWLACPLPCGSPCVRLPCDLRCAKQLGCGHRCPLVCGEDCPQNNEVGCRECAVAQGDEKTLNQIADVVMHSALRDIDPSENPLVSLRCGHMFTIESIDGILELGKFYGRGPNGQWQSVTPFDDNDALKACPCPTCGVPIQGPKRYGRVLRKTDLDKAQQTFVIATNTFVREQATKREEVRKQLENRILDVRAVVDPAQCHQLHQKIDKVLSRINRELKEQKPPTQDLHAKAQHKWNVLIRSGRAPPGLVGPEFALTRQPNVELLKEKLQCCITKMFLLANMPRPVSRPKKGKKDKKNAASQPSPAPDPVDIARQQCDLVLQFFSSDCVPTSNQLQAECTEFKMNFSLQESRLIEAELHLGLINCLAVFGKWKLDIRTTQVRALNHLQRLLDLLSTPEMVKFQDRFSNIAQQAQAWNRRLRDTFHDEITVEEKRAVFQALASDVGSGVGSFGGHWYKCPNGHVYAIGECGGAMRQSICPECKAPVGGTNHQLDSRNAVATEFLAEVHGPVPSPSWRQDARNVFEIPPDNRR
jgi:hypothetical protein